MLGNYTKPATVQYWLPVILLPAANLLMLFFSPADFNLRMILLSLVGAVGEEFFFRCFLLQHIFLRKLKPIPAILIVSVFFAGMHLFNLRAGTGITDTLIQMLFAFCFSIWAGAVTWKSTWLIPLLAHVLLNATAGAENIWVALVVSAVVLADGVMIMMTKQRNVEKRSACNDLSNLQCPNDSRIHSSSV